VPEENLVHFAPQIGTGPHGLPCHDKATDRRGGIVWTAPLLGGHLPFHRAADPRHDLLYHDPINPDVIHHRLRHPLVCAIPGWQWFHGCNDRFAICGQDAARVYGTRGRILAEYCRQLSRPLASEGLLRFALLRAGISIVALPLRASRVRLGGKIRPEQFTGCCWRRPGPQLHLWRARLAHALIRRHLSES